MKRTILILDDDHDICTFLKETINDHNSYHIITVHTIADAISASKKWKIDLSVVDWVLPNESTGMEYILAIRQINKNHPIIIVSGYINERHVLKEVDPRFNKVPGPPIIVLEKPSSMGFITAIIGDILGGIYDGKDEHR